MFIGALADRKTGQIDPLRVTRAVGGVAGAIETFVQPQAQALITHLIGPWALGIARLAPAKWLLPVGVAPACALEVGPRLCGGFAIGACHACGRPICLGHALVSADATLVCWACMRLAAQHAKRWAPPGAQAQGAAGRGLDWAYTLLGVSADSTQEEIKKAYKIRIGRFHPDKIDTGDDPGPNGDLVRLLTQAYDLLVAQKKASK